MLPRWTIFDALLDFVETQKLYEFKVQQTIDKLSKVYYYVYCDRTTKQTRDAISAIEQGKYILCRETKGDLSCYTFSNKQYKCEEETLFRCQEFRGKENSRQHSYPAVPEYFNR